MPSSDRSSSTHHATGPSSAQQKLEVGRNFERAAPCYGAHSLVQQQSAALLLELLQAGLASLASLASSASSASSQQELGKLADIGCGDAYLEQCLWQQGYRCTDLCAIDLAPTMLQQANARLSALEGFVAKRLELLCADAESLDYSSYDLVLSNFCLQWFEQPAIFLQKLKTPFLAVALPLATSLAELRTYLSSKLGRKLLYDLPQLSDFEALCSHWEQRKRRFIVKRHSIEIWHQSPYAALCSLKAMGAQTSDKTPLSFSELQRIRKDHFAIASNFDVLFLLALG